MLFFTQCCAFSYDLQQNKLQIFRFRNCRHDRMVKGGPSDLDQTDLNTGILCGFQKHFHELFLRHEMRTGIGRKIAASRQELHGFGIDFAISSEGIAEGAAAFGKGRRIKNDQIKMSMFGPQLRQHFKDITLPEGLPAIHASTQSSR